MLLSLFMYKFEGVTNTFLITVSKDQDTNCVQKASHQNFFSTQRRRNRSNIYTASGNKQTDKMLPYYENKTEVDNFMAHLKSISLTDLCALGSSKMGRRLGHSKILRCPFCS